MLPSGIAAGAYQALEPWPQLGAAPSTDDPDGVAGVLDETLQDGQYLHARFAVVAGGLGEGAVIVQEEQPLGRPASKPGLDKAFQMHVAAPCLGNRATRPLPDISGQGP